MRELTKKLVSLIISLALLAAFSGGALAEAAVDAAAETRGHYAF